MTTDSQSDEGPGRLERDPIPNASISGRDVRELRQTDGDDEDRQWFRLTAVRKRPDEGVAGRVPVEELAHAVWSERDPLGKLMSARLSDGGSVSDVRVLKVKFDRTVQVLLSLSVCIQTSSDRRRQKFADKLFLAAKRFGDAFGVRPEPISVSPELSAALSDALTVSVATALERDGGQVLVDTRVEPLVPRRARRDPTSWDRWSPLVTALATGAGVIGLATLVGGMIAWARVRAAGLPPAPTLGILPRQDLVVIGTETLVPAVLIAIAVVVLLGVLYRFIRATFQPSPHRHWLNAHERAFLAGEAGLLATAGMFFFILIALLAILGLHAVLYADLKAEQLFGAVLVVAFAATIAGLVGSVTRRFAYLATTAFTLVGIFGGVLAYWRAGNEEQVRGAAVWRQDHRAIYGIFVAEGAARVYLAQFRRAANGDVVAPSARLIGIAKSDVADIAIADREPLPQALDRGKQLAEDLCSLRPSPGAQLQRCVTELPTPP